jgi:hypothetical protein
MALNLRETLEPGRYAVLLASQGSWYAAEKRDTGEWFFVDGTGWSEKFDDQIEEAEAKAKTWP